MYSRDLGFSVTVCKDINNHDAENSAVEARTSEINMYMSILSSIPCMVVALFIGPWSDRNGRKPVMVIPMIGREKFGTFKICCDKIIDSII